MLYREYPEKSFKSFSLLANALPIGIPAEGLDLGILQPEIGILHLEISCVQAVFRKYSVPASGLAGLRGIKILSVNMY